MQAINFINNSTKHVEKHEDASATTFPVTSLNVSWFQQSVVHRMLLIFQLFIFN